MCAEFGAAIANSVILIEWENQNDGAWINAKYQRRERYCTRTCQKETLCKQGISNMKRLDAGDHTTHK